MGAKFAVLLDDTVLDADAINAVSAMTVELNTAEASTASVTFSLTKNTSGAWSLLDDPRFAPFAKLGVRLGFGSGAGALGSALGGAFGGGGAADALTHVFDGYVTGVETQFGGGANSATLTVTGIDPCALLNSEEKVASWPDQSDSDIVSAILGTYSVTPQTTATTTTHAEATTTIVQRGSDLAFVRRLARRNGFEFYFEPSDDGTMTGYFQPPQLDGTPQKTLAIQFGEDSNLRSFATRLNARKPQAVKTAQVDVTSGETASASVTDSAYTKLGASDDASLIGGALAAVVTPAENAGEMRVLGAPSAEETELTALAQAVRDEASWFISATGEVNAEAYGSVLRPHRTVLVKGAGKPYSGAYYVVHVTHQLDGTGTYTMKFEALRNARDVKGDEAFAGAAGGVALPGLP
jgi:phage protein D